MKKLLPLLDLIILIKIQMRPGMERDFETVALLPVFRRIEIQISSDNSVSNLSGKNFPRMALKPFTIWSIRTG